MLIWKAEVLRMLSESANMKQIRHREDVRMVAGVEAVIAGLLQLG